MSSAVAPCEWPLVSCGGPGACSHLDNLTDELRNVMERSAIEYLWSWSGQRFGLCEVSVRPCEEECKNQFSTYRGWSGAPAGQRGGWAGPGQGWYPVIMGGNWFNIICGRCNASRCGCSELSSILLPGPAHEITEILIDGEVLDPSAYRLDNLGLSRIDGGSWPKCQDMSKDPSPESPDDATDTFQVTFTQGTPVPYGGQLAAGTLACEFAKQSCGDKTCRLPRRATQVAREGVTVMLTVDESLFTTGALGIFEIDNFLSSIQAGARGGYRVTSPDVKPFRRS